MISKIESVLKAKLYDCVRFTTRGAKVENINMRYLCIPHLWEGMKESGSLGEGNWDKGRKGGSLLMSFEIFTTCIYCHSDVSFIIEWLGLVHKTNTNNISGKEGENEPRSSWRGLILPCSPARSRV